MAAKLDPLEILERCDLDSVRKQIAGLVEERDAQAASYNKRIDALKVIEKALDIAKNGKPKKGPKKKPAAGSGESYSGSAAAANGKPDRDTVLIHSYLLKNGPQGRPQIYAALKSSGVHHKTVESRLSQTEYFVRELDGNYRARGSQPLAAED